GRVHLGAAIERRGAAPRILPDGRRFGAHFFTAFPRFGYPTRTPDIAGGSTALTLRAAPPRQGQHARADHAKFVICDHTIERLFKLWKSHGHIDASRSGKPWRVLCAVDAK